MQDAVEFLHRMEIKKMHKVEKSYSKNEESINVLIELRKN